MWSESRDAEASFWDTHSWPREPGQERKESTVNTSSSVPPSSHKVVSKGPALVRLGARVRVRRRESPRAAGASR